MTHFFLKWILSRKIICFERKKNALYSNHVFITETAMAAANGMIELRMIFVVAWKNSIVIFAKKNLQILNFQATTKLSSNY